MVFLIVHVHNYIYIYIDTLVVLLAELIGAYYGYGSHDWFLFYFIPFVISQVLFLSIQNWRANFNLPICSCKYRGLDRMKMQNYQMFTDVQTFMLILILIIGWLFFVHSPTHSNFCWLILWWSLCQYVNLSTHPSHLHWVWWTGDIIWWALLWHSSSSLKLIMDHTNFSTVNKSELYTCFKYTCAKYPLSGCC